MTGTEFCPYCEEEKTVDTVERDVVVPVRGEEIPVTSVVHICTECGGEFACSADSPDPVEAAFSKYRATHGMLSPSEILSFRRKYELTQKELSALLGWGAVTLSRYENGSLQDAAHDRQLQAAMTSEGLEKLVQLNPEALDPVKRERTLCVIGGRRGLRRGTLGSVEDLLSEMPPCIMNGFRRFSVGRFSAVVESFLRDGCVYKTVLNKLLFYADFQHFRDFGVSITGCRYAKLQYGPVPEDYKTLLGVLEEDAGVLQTEIVDFPGKDYKGEPVRLINSLNEYCLSPDEERTLGRISDAFRGFGALEIAELSHAFPGWIETAHSRLISYEYAVSLELPKKK